MTPSAPITVPHGALSPNGRDHDAIAAVIVTFNRAGTLGRALESVLAQTRPADDILIVDDGSTDGTAALVAAFGRRVRYLWQPNGGVGAARRRGLAKARGRWVAYLDSDDAWTPGHLAGLASAIRETHGRAALYFADVALATGAGAPRHWEACPFDPSAPVTLFADGARIALMPLQPVLLQGSAVDREAALAVAPALDGLRTREDTLLVFLLALARPVCAVRQVGVVLGTDGGGRLTRAHGPAGAVYNDATIRLYRSALKAVADDRVEVRRVLSGRLQSAYLSGLFRALRHGQFRRAITLGRAAQSDCGPQLAAAAFIRVLDAVRRRLVFAPS